MNSPVLTQRERQVAELVCLGLANKQIGASLGISAATVDGYLRTVFAKFGVNNRTLLALKFCGVELPAHVNTSPQKRPAVASYGKPVPA